jgi:hypothetical protein
MTADDLRQVVRRFKEVYARAGKALPEAPAHPLRRTPKPVALMQQDYPQAHADLVSSVQLLERHMADMQDCEFTVQEGERGGGGAQA